MKRLVLLGLAVAAFLPLVAMTPSPAGAAVPCRDRIYNDWYPDGKIATNYPIACYRDALKHVRTDLREYSNLVDDIRSAMQAALARLHHKTVPPEVGKSGKAPDLQSAQSPTGTPHDPSLQQVSSTLPNNTSTVASGSTGDSGGVPLPLLVLGALALLLAAVGGVGVVAKRRSSS